MITVVRYAFAFFLVCLGILILVFAADYAYGRYVIYTQIVPVVKQDIYNLEQSYFSNRPDRDLK